MSRTPISSRSSPAGATFTLIKLLVVIGILAVPMTSSHAQPPTRTTSPVVDFNPPNTVRGSSTLVRTDNGVTIHVTTSNLMPGNAYSVWWVIFENGLMNPPSAVGNATGFVGVSPLGTHTFAAQLSEGTILTGHPVFVGTSLRNARTAPIRVVIRCHGPVDPRRIREQTRTFEPNNPVAFDAQITHHVMPPP